MSAQVQAPLLTGLLSGFALADVLQLLELGARSGTLNVDGGPLGDGALRLANGRLVGLTLGGACLEPDADWPRGVATLLELSAGHWAFYPADDATPDRGARVASCVDGVRLSAVLMDAARQGDERARRSATRAGNVDVPMLADDDAHGDSPAALSDALELLTASDLQVLAAIDGARGAPEIARIVRRDVPQIQAVLGRLRVLGLVQPAAIHPDWRPTSPR